MKPYFYKARLSRELVSRIISDAPRFQETMKRSIAAFGGRVIRCHLSSGIINPEGFLEFPHDIAAQSWNEFYGRQQGVTSSRISRLLDDDDLAQLHRQIEAQDL